VNHEHGGHEHAGPEHGGHEHLSHVPDAAQPAVYAARAATAMRPPVHADQVEAMVHVFFSHLSHALAKAGCTLVGHIKGFIAAGDGGDLAFHGTVLGAEPAVTGGFSGAVAEAELTINVIVFGVDEQALPAMVHGAWSRAAGAETTWS
jgi:hypothetical protein